MTYVAVTEPPMASHRPSKVRAAVLKYLNGRGIVYDRLLQPYILSSNVTPLQVS